MDIVYLGFCKAFDPVLYSIIVKLEWCGLRSRRIICWTGALEWSLVIQVWRAAVCNWCSLEISIGPATVKHIGQIGENVSSANLWMIPNRASDGCAGGYCCLLGGFWAAGPRTCWSSAKTNAKSCIWDGMCIGIGWWADRLESRFARWGLVCVNLYCETCAMLMTLLLGCVWKTWPVD